MYTYTEILVHSDRLQNAEVAKNEVARLKGLSHPRVTDYYGCEMKNNKILIYMEYLAGGSLRRIIDTSGALEEKEALTYTAQVLDGLAYVHSVGIVHSDLKCK